MVEILKAFKSAPPDDHPERTIDLESQPDDDSANVTVSSAGWLSPRYATSHPVQLDWDAVTRNHCVGLLPDTHEAEYYKLLRIQIRQHMAERKWKTVMITSVAPGEGKTVTAINLAAMMAREYTQTILLVDTDLRNQAIRRYLGYDYDKGLADYLLDDCPLQRIIVWPGIEKLTLISGGRTVNNSAETLNSPRMLALVREMKQRYGDRYIFFDLPPMLGNSDALSFAPLVDAILLVVAAGRTPMPEVRKALALLPREKILGLVLNRRP